MNPRKRLPTQSEKSSQVETSVSKHTVSDALLTVGASITTYVQAKYLALVAASKRFWVQTKQNISSAFSFLINLDAGAIFAIMVLFAFTFMTWYNCILGGFGLYYLYISIKKS